MNKLLLFCLFSALHQAHSVAVEHTVKCELYTAMRCERACWDSTIQIDYDELQLDVGKIPDNSQEQKRVEHEYDFASCPRTRGSVWVYAYCTVPVPEDANDSDKEWNWAAVLSLPGGVICGDEDVCCERWLGTSGTYGESNQRRVYADAVRLEFSGHPTDEWQDGPALVKRSLDEGYDDDRTATVDAEHTRVLNDDEQEEHRVHSDASEWQRQHARASEQERAARRFQATLVYRRRAENQEHRVIVDGEWK